MAGLYSNENFPRRVVETLRLLGHDVLTSHEAGRANQKVRDDEVLRFATEPQRAVLTLNRLDFFRLHRATDGQHAGISPALAMMRTQRLWRRGLIPPSRQRAILPEKSSGWCVRLRSRPRKNLPGKLVNQERGHSGMALRQGWFGMFFLRVILAGKIADLVPGLGQQLIVLRPSFLGARLAATRALGHRIAGDGGQHLIDKLILFAGRPSRRGDHARPMAQGIERSFKADPLQGHPMQVRAALHEAAH